MQEMIKQNILTTARQDNFKNSRFQASNQDFAEGKELKPKAKIFLCPKMHSYWLCVGYAGARVGPLLP